MLPIIQIILPSYGVCAGIGLIAAVILFLFRKRSVGLDINKTKQMMIAAVIGLVIGSRLVFVLTMIPNIIADFSWQRLFGVILMGGFVFYGGLLGAILGIYIYCKCKKLDMQPIFNAITPCFPLFHCFGRIGCFMAGCCYGIPGSFGVPMAFDPNTVRCPVQLVEAICCFVIFIVLIVVEKKKEGAPLLAVYLLSYAVVRFLLEFLRGDTVRGIWGFLSTSQWISLAIAAAVIITAVRKKRSFNKST